MNACGVLEDIGYRRLDFEHHGDSLSIFLSIGGMGALHIHFYPAVLHLSCFLLHRHSPFLLDLGHYEQCCTSPDYPSPTPAYPTPPPAIAQTTHRPSGYHPTPLGSACHLSHTPPSTCRHPRVPDLPTYCYASWTTTLPVPTSTSTLSHHPYLRATSLDHPTWQGLLSNL
eukprot:766332-Hanusia_phi.AAC.1